MSNSVGMRVSEWVSGRREGERNGGERLFSQTSLLPNQDAAHLGGEWVMQEAEARLRVSDVV
jgi:hypothetical protein